MAAGSFSNSQYPAILVKITEAFMGGGHGIASMFDKPYQGAEFLANNQTFRVQPNIQNGQCNDAYAWYWFDTNDNDGYSDTTADSGLDSCDLPSGIQGESGKVTLANNVFMHEIVEVDEQGCANAADLNLMLANALNLAMAKNRRKLNARFYTHLQAVNMAAPSAGSTGYTVDGGGLIEIPAASWTVDLIGKLHEIAAVNYMSNFLILTGTNLNVPFWNARFNQLDFDKKSEQGKVNTLGNIGFDLVGAGSTYTYMVNPDSIGFWQATPYFGYGYEMREQPVTNGIGYVYLLNDPIFKFVQYDAAGRRSLVPLTYVVEHQILCDARDGNGNKTTKHRLLVRFVGGLHQAPTVGGRTGVIQLEKVA